MRSYLNERRQRTTTIQERVEPGSRPDRLQFVNDGGLSEDERGGGVYGRISRATSAKNWARSGFILDPALYSSRLDGLVESAEHSMDGPPRLREKASVFCAEEPDPRLPRTLPYVGCWRQGHPYITLMENNINHSQTSTVSTVFADSLMAIFPKSDEGKGGENSAR